VRHLAYGGTGRTALTEHGDGSLDCLQPVWVRRRGRYEETVFASRDRWRRDRHCSTAAPEQRQRLAGLPAALMGGMMEHMLDD